MECSKNLAGNVDCRSEFVLTGNQNIGIASVSKASGEAEEDVSDGTKISFHVSSINNTFSFSPAQCKTPGDFCRTSDSEKDLPAKNYSDLSLKGKLKIAKHESTFLCRDNQKKVRTQACCKYSTQMIDGYIGDKKAKIAKKYYSNLDQPCSANGVFQRALVEELNPSVHK